MPTQIEKLEAYAGHLLDAFILLRERYALLHPMLFDKDVVARHGAKDRARGFNILMNSLFLSCAQDIDNLYCEMTELWAKLSTAPEMKALRAIRDKISAHAEVRYSADQYQFVDVSKLGLKWGDLKKIVDTMQRLVELLGLIVRNAGFAWEMLDEQLDTASRNFWNG